MRSAVLIDDAGSAVAMLDTFVEYRKQRSLAPAARSRTASTAWDCRHRLERRSLGSHQRILVALGVPVSADPIGL